MQPFNRNTHVWALASLALIAGTLYAADPIVDGVLGEWEGIAPIATDPAGDSIGPLDVTALRALSRGSRLFVQIDVANTLNLSSGPGTDTTLRLVAATGGRTITVDFRQRTAYLDGNPANSVSWPVLSFSALPTFATNRFEMELDMGVIGAGVGSPVTLAFQGADILASPPVFTMTQPGVAAPRRSTARSHCVTLRVASLNTEFSGLIDMSRRDALVRLIDCADADVYTFQEEYNSTAAQVQTALHLADPLDDGSFWNVLKSGELTIASPHPLVQVTLGSGYYGAVVRRPEGDVLAITTHLKCCGYTGNTDDATRISQTTAAVAQFNAFRAGTHSAPLIPYRNVPAVLIGDWNLVGSRTPLTMWEASPGPAMTNAIMRQQIGDEGWTWASPSGTGFWPGVLDLGVYDAARIRLARAFSIGSLELTPPELTEMGLLINDSLATDHRLIVMDFTTAPDSDLNNDGVVTTADLTLLLSRFGQSVPSGTDADINGDGQVNTADLTLMLAQFGRTCG